MQKVEIEAQTITEAYMYSLSELKKLKDKPSRLGATKELIDATVIIRQPETRHIIEPLRKHNMQYVVEEIKWYLSGNYNPEPIAKYAQTWNLVTDEDGLIQSNYGAKLFHEKVRGMTQFERAYHELNRDINSRRAIVFFNLYPIDYCRMHTTKDFVCTVYGHFIMNEGNLDFLVYMRSNDLIFGWSNDVPWFTLLQEMMATKLDVPMGEYRHHAGSLHIYERHYKKLSGTEYLYKYDLRSDYHKEVPFKPMVKSDVTDLIAQKYWRDTPFMKSFRKWSK